MGDPQIVPLPFPVEETISYNDIYHKNRSKGLSKLLKNNTQFHALFTVVLKSKEKPKKKSQGGFKIVDDNDDEEVEDEFEDGDGDGMDE